MAVSGDSAPHFTTLAAFVASLGEELARLFAPSHTDRMKLKIDSELGKRMIAARFATVEPVFGNLRHNKRLTRFTLRGSAKVDGQWKLFCMMHNIEKLAHHGYAQ